VEGRPAVKLSDNYEKTLGPASEVERYRRNLGTEGRDRCAGCGLNGKPWNQAGMRVNCGASWGCAPAVGAGHAARESYGRSAGDRLSAGVRPTTATSSTLLMRRLWRRPEWVRRFDQEFMRRAGAAESLDSDRALAGAGLVHEFRCPADERLLHTGVADSMEVRRRLGVEGDERLSLAGRRGSTQERTLDRTEVDLRLGFGLLVEAKLTEGDFQTRNRRSGGGLTGL